MRPHPPALLALILIATLAGCMAPTPQHVQDWAAEADAHGLMGQSARFDLEAERFVVVGEGILTAEAMPFVVVNEPRTPRDDPCMFFHGTVSGHGDGLLVLDGARIDVQEAAIGRLPVARVMYTDPQATLRVLGDHPPPQIDIRFPEGAQEIESDWFFAAKTTVHLVDLHVADGERALFISNGTMIELEFPLRFDADVIGLSTGSHLEANRFTVGYDRFAYGADDSTGTIRIDEGPLLTDPQGVFGSDAALHFDGRKVRTLEPFRLTQALTPGGYAIDADVEIRAESSVTRVDPGNISWVRVDHREKGYLGAAVLRNVTVTGDAAEVVRLPLDRPPWLVEELWDAVGDAGMAAPFAALPVAIASPFLLVGEALLKGADCLFDDCPSERPYPRWSAPGEIGRFYYQVDATDAAPGTYEGTIEIEGENHRTVTLPVRIEIG